MSVCSLCGSPLQKGARFCSGCGVPLDTPRLGRTKRSQEPEHFCFHCGAPMAPATPKAKKALPSRLSPGEKFKVQPDVKGFYKKGQVTAVSVSDHALVWSCPQGHLYRLNADKQLLRAKVGRISILDTMQSAQDIVVLIRNYKEDRFELLTLDGDLNVCMRRTLWQYQEMPDVLTNRTFGLLNQRFAGFGWPNRGYSKMHFLRISLDNGIESRFDVSSQLADVNPFGTRIIMGQDGKLYFSCLRRIKGEDPDQERLVPAWMYVDFTMDRLEQLWKPASDGEKQPLEIPEFFDFAKDVMWCTRVSSDQKRRTLLPRRISDAAPLPNVPSLSFPAYLDDESRCAFCYFDGKYAFYDGTQKPKGLRLSPWVATSFCTVVWPQNGVVVTGDGVRWEICSDDGKPTGETLKVVEAPEIE